jgi:coatomer subunit zeta
MSSLSLLSVIAILILCPEASNPRLFAKYYQAPHTSNNSTEPKQPYVSLKDQRAFEKGLLEKTAKQTSDIILYDNKVVIFKTEGDVMFYVVGGAEENEILLYNVVLALRDSLAILLRSVRFHSPFL